MLIFKRLFPFNMFSNGVPFNIIISVLFTCMFYRYLKDSRGAGAICLFGVHLMLLAFYENISEFHFMFYEILVLFTLTFTYEIYIATIFNGKKIKKMQDQAKAKAKEQAQAKIKEQVQARAKAQAKAQANAEWLNFEIKHGGTQNIPEFLDGKSLKICMYFQKTIKDLKFELSEKISHNPNPKHIILRTKTFGKILADETKLKDAPLILFIAIPGY